MARPKRQLIALAMLGAATAGGGAALAAAPGTSLPSSTPRVNAAAPTPAAPSTAALRAQVHQLVSEDQGLRSALHHARHHLVAKIHSDNRLIARQHAAIAHAPVAPAPAVHNVAPAPVATHAPRPVVQPTRPKPSPKPTTHATTRASGGGHGGGRDDGGSGGGSDDGGGGGGGGDD